MPRMNQTVVKKANSDSSKQSSTKTKRSAGTKKSTEKESAKTSSKQSDNKKAKRDYEKKKADRILYKTHDGHALTPLEAKFIDLYIETGNQRQSVIEAGYKTNTPSQYVQLP